MRKLAIWCGSFALTMALAVMIVPSEHWISCVGYCVAGMVFCALFLRRHWAGRAMLIALLAGAIAFGYLDWWTAENVTFSKTLTGETHRITGVVTQWPQETQYGYSVLVDLQFDGEADISTLLYVDEQGADLRPADQIFTIARLNDGATSSAGDEITYYTAKGILLWGTCYGALEIERPDEVPFMLRPAYWSRALQEGIETAFPEDIAPLFVALVTGNRTNLTDTFTSSLQRTGLSHVVAVSGMHLAFLAGMLSALLGRNRRRTSLVIIPISIIFALVVGATPSITRACIMIVLLHLAPLFDREGDGFTSLSVALVLILMNNPYAVNHIGLQLSFASVLGIFCFADKILRALTGKIPKKFGRKGSPICRVVGGFFYTLSAIFAATASAMSFSTPLVAYYFGAVSLIAPLANLLVLWAISVCFAGGIITGAVAMLAPSLAQAMALCFAPIARYVDQMTGMLGRVPFASLPSTSPYAMGWLIFAYIVIIFAIWKRKTVRLWMVALVLAIGLYGAVTFQIQDAQHGQFSITALDVGQGQSVLLRMGEQSVLVDCGGSDGELTGDIAADTLISGGNLSLDYLILTHCHLDHAGGVIQLLSRLDVGTLVLPNREGEDDGLRADILAEAQERNIPVWLVDSMETFHLSGTEVTLFPPMGDTGENELGLCVLTTYGDFDTLITGDMGMEGEERLVATGRLPQLEVLVAGHHGSKYSTGEVLLNETAPEHVIISVGQNSFGHPADEMLTRLSDREITIYRTDLMGNVTIKTG